MKNSVITLLVVVAVVFGIGIYRGWFSVDQRKLEQDEIAAKSALQDLEQKVKDETTGRNKPVAEKKK